MSNPRQAGWEKLVAPLDEITPSALAGPGVSSPTASTEARTVPVSARIASNASARASTATSGPSSTRLGVSMRRSTRNRPDPSSTVALFVVPPLSIPTTTCRTDLSMGSPSPEWLIVNQPGERSAVSRPCALAGIVGRFLRLEVSVEEIEDDFGTLPAMRRRPGAGELMALGWKAHELDVPLQNSQRDEHLLGLLDRTPQVIFGVDDQKRRRDVANVADRRHRLIELRSVEVALPEIHTEGAREVACPVQTQQVVGRSLAARRAETIGVSDGP